MLKKIGSLIVILALSLSLFACGRKGKELTPEERSNLESLAKAAVSFEVIGKYGLEPGITVDKLTAYDIQGDVYVRTEFDASGSYTVKDEAGDLYSGTFKVTGYSEGHGVGWDSCEITQPKNGTKVLPEQSGGLVMETENDPVITTQAETSESDLAGPLADYIDANVSEMGRIVDPPHECDINGDGNPELCTTVTYGSGIISTALVVYDVYNGQGYILDDRMTYDYLIIGSTADDIAIERTEYGGDQKSYGTLAIQDGKLIFVENEAYGATTPVG